MRHNAGVLPTPGTHLKGSLNYTGTQAYDHELQQHFHWTTQLNACTRLTFDLDPLQRDHGTFKNRGVPPIGN